MADADILSEGSSINTVAGKRGEYRVIRTDGTEIGHEGKPTIKGIERIIGCSGLDTVHPRLEAPNS